MRVGLGRYDGYYTENSSFFLGGILFSAGSAANDNNHPDLIICSIADALLGAAALGGIFQSTNYSDKLKKSAGELLRYIEKEIHYRGYKIANIDVSILTSHLNIEKKIIDIHSNLISWLYLKSEQLNLKLAPVIDSKHEEQGYQVRIIATALLNNRF